MSAAVTDDPRVPVSQADVWVSGRTQSGRAGSEAIAADSGSFADDDAKTRQQYLSEEMRARSKRFRRRSAGPICRRWRSDSRPGKAHRGQGVAGRGFASGRACGRLVEAAPYLTIVQRRALAEQLEAPGSSPPARRQAWRPRSRGADSGGIAEKTGPGPWPGSLQVRVLRLIAVLTEFSVTLDQLSGTSGSKSRRSRSCIATGPESDFRKIAGPISRGRRGVHAQISQVVDKTRS